MSVIDKIMKNDSAMWINQQIEKLPDRAKFRASNAVRSLQWANAIYESDLPIPACYCALHATEEAVAAFISCAKECGYGDNAKINIKDHAAKATVSLLAQKVSTILESYSVAVAYDPRSDTLAARYTLGGEAYYNEVSTKLFHFIDNEKNVRKYFHDELIKMFDDVGELEIAVSKGQEARNAIFYATSSSYPAGFDEPEASLGRECQITLGLIWAAIDIRSHEGELIPFIDQALRTANIVIAELKAKKR